MIPVVPKDGRFGLQFVARPLFYKAPSFLLLDRTIHLGSDPAAREARRQADGRATQGTRPGASAAAPERARAALRGIGKAQGSSLVGSSSTAASAAYAAAAQGGTGLGPSSRGAARAGLDWGGWIVKTV